MSDELKPLTKTDLATLAEYFKTWNGTRAWMETHPRSSYNAARASASEWLAKPNIKAAIADKLAELHMSADEALKLTADIARGDVGDFMAISSVGFNLDLDAAREAGKTNLIKKVSQKTIIDGKNDKETHIIDVELYDRQAALRDILKIHGKFTDKLKIEGGVEMVIKRLGVDIDKI